MNQIVSFLRDRLSEPSTFVSLAVLLGGAGVSLDATVWQYIFLGVSTLFAVLGVVMGEKPTQAFTLLREALTQASEVEKRIAEAQKQQPQPAGEPANSTDAPAVDQAKQ